jgi:hypothetical protein
MSSLFKIKTPDVKTPEPERMPDPEMEAVQRKKREEELKRTARGGREKMNLGNVESGGGKEYAGTVLGS